MSIIEEYTVVYDDTPRELGETVQRKIVDGWQPYGSPYFDKGTLDEFAKHCQAIVRYKRHC